MAEVCLSSELYKIETADIAALPDGKPEAFGKFKDKIVVLIGDSSRNEKDVLLKGRQAVQQAMADGDEHIPVRFVFVSKMKKYDFVSLFVKALRSHYKIFSSNIYHMDPLEIRRIKIERNIRTKENAYVFSNPLFYYNEQERKKQYSELYNSMKKGYDDNFPLDVMLLRMMGIKDTVNQGHHRMGIAVECKLPRVSIRFSAAGGAPRLLQPLLRIVAKININLKLRNKNK